MAPPVGAVEALAGLQARPRPPLVEGMPVIGNLLAFLNDPLSLMYSGYRRHGPVFRISLAGQMTNVFAGPEATRFITKEERTYFSTAGLLDNAARIFETSKECIMVALDGERHREVRTHQKDAMSRGFFDDHFAEAASLAESYFAGLPLGEELPITEFAKRLIFNQLGQVMSGEFKPELFESAKVIMDTLVKPWTNYLPYHPRAKAALRTFRTYAEDLQRRSSDEDKITGDRNLSQTLFAGVRTGMYEQRDVPLLLSGPYIAGLDTAAHALAFALYSVLAYPGVAAELRAELDSTLAEGEPITSATLRQMELVKGAVMESMRLHPVTVLQTRTALIDFTANGYQIRKGERVLFAATVAHRMAEFYPNPEIFDIHRFEKGRAEHRAPGAYHPYGAGPHTCLGAGAADVIVALNLATLLRRYDVRLSPVGYRLKVKMIPTPGPVNLRIRLAPRRRAET